MSSYDVRVWAIRRRPDRRLPYQVRWTVAGAQKSESFLTRALAESYRADLIKAARRGEPFDPVTGLPESKARDITWFQHACDYVEMKWPRAAAKSRKSMAEALTTVTVALLARKHGRPPDQAIRSALYGWAFGPERHDREPTSEVAEALDWIARASRPVSALTDLGTVREVLDALAVRLDGKPAAATTMYRKRAVFYNAVGWAVERKLLATNPIDQVQWTAPEVAEAIDRRVVASPEQVRELLAAVSEVGRRGDHLAAFFGCLYYAGTRPSEAVALRRWNCVLPDSRWGYLELTGSEPRAGLRWTDSGQAREARELKRRSRSEVRRVPIPPVLVGMLRGHVDRYGLGEDDRVFYSARGGPLQESVYRQVWAKARLRALGPEQVGSPLARRPYDLRHAAASLWLNAGVPATEVARRLGHSVAVLLKVYANCVDGQEGAVNARVLAALDDPAERETLTEVPEPMGPETESCGPVADQGE